VQPRNSLLQKGSSRQRYNSFIIEFAAVPVVLRFYGLAYN